MPAKVKLVRINDTKMGQLLIEELELRDIEQEQSFMEGMILQLSIGGVAHSFHSRKHSSQKQQIKLPIFY